VREVLPVSRKSATAEGSGQDVEYWFETQTMYISADSTLGSESRRNAGKAGR
jgi:hypothetical protein